jgi:hypothetical protein
MSEERATTIFDADNTKLLAAAREVDAAIGGLNRTAAASSASATASATKLSKAWDKTASSVSKVDDVLGGTAGSAKKVIDGVQGVVGKLSGYLGAAGLIIGAVTGIVALTVEWGQEQAGVNKAAERELELAGYRAELADEQFKKAAAADAAAVAAADRRAASAQADRTEEQLALDHQIAQQEILGGQEVYRNELKIQALELQLEYASSQTSSNTQAWVEVKALERSIELLQLKNTAISLGVGGPSRGGGGGRSRAPEIAANADPKFEDLSDQLATREQAVNARRLSAIEAERAALAEVEAFRFESEIALLELSEGNGAKIHELNMSAIEAERAAADAALEARENALRSDGTGDALDRLAREDELKQVVHERDMNRLEADLSMRQAVAEESKRIAEEQKAELERQLSTISEVTSAVESVASNLAGKLGEFASMRMEQEAAELEQYTAGLEARGRQQSAALDREIAQARGNAARLAKLQEQKRKLEESTGKAIEKAKADHAAKADKIERVQKGTSMLLTGAQEVVETAAAYPNPVSMAAHAVAAALAFGFGAAVLAGGTPGAGGGGGAASMGGGSSSGGSNVEFGEAAKTPGSLGTSAGTAPKLAQTSSANGSTVFNGPVTFNSNGSIDRAAAESIALESGKAARSREGAGRT